MSALAEGYAAAFFEIARAEGALAGIEDELLAFARAFDTSPELQQTLGDVAIPAERRLGIVSDLLGSRAHPLTANLVSLVVGAGRAREIPAVVASLLARAAAEKDRASGEVRSAVPLSDDQKQRLVAAVEKATGKKVELKYIVDPAVIGGVVTKVGDTIIDGSLRTRLEELREAL